MRSAIQFFWGLPAALLMTGALAEKFQVILLLETLALKFRAVSAAFWEALFSLLPFSFNYNPDIVSTYSLLTVPVVVDALRGKLAPLGAPETRYWYIAGLAAVALIISGYQAWGFLSAIFGIAWASFLAGLGFSLLYLAMMTLTFLLTRSLLTATILGQLIVWGMLLTWGVGALFGFDMVAAIEGAAWLPNLLRGLILGYLGLINWSVYGSFLAVMLTLVVMVLAPRSRTPVFVVAWVALFFAADWVNRSVLPGVMGWVESL